MKTKGAIVFAVCLLLVGTLGVLLTGCQMGEGTGRLTINLGDKVLKGSKAVLPTESLVGDHFEVYGLGTSGQAAGATFTMDVSSAGTAVVDLLPGEWTIIATVYNAADVAIGEGTEEATIVVGSPVTISIDCLPYAGDGTLNMAASWVPDVIAAPQIEVEAVAFGGASYPVTMTLDSSTAAHGSAVLPQGWYTGFLRIKDAGELSAGIVRSVRVAADMTTAWTEFLTVNQLSGEITFDLSWAPGLPLNLTTDPAAGVVTLCAGQSRTLGVTGADNDAGTSLVYAWYLNGVATAIGTTASYTVDGDDFAPGGQYYLSCIVFQNDGKRAGDAQWQINQLDVGPEGLDVRVLFETATGGRHYIAQVFNSTGTVEVRRQLIVSPHSGTREFEFVGLPVGSYYVHVFEDITEEGVQQPSEHHRWWQAVPDTGGLAAVPGFAANVIVPNDGTVVYTVPSLGAIQ